MSKAYVNYNESTGEYELVIARSSFVCYRNKDASKVYDYADRKGYDLVEYD